MIAPLTDSSAWAGAHAELRQRLSADGYLYLKGVVPAARISAVRSAVAGVLVDAGWLRDRRGDDLTVAPGMLREAHGAARQVSDAVFRREAVHALGHTDELVQLFRGLLGADLLIHPRPFARLVLPVLPDGPVTTTAAHQDFVSQQGAEDTLTAWLPLHSMSLEHGPLAVAPGSHLRGILPFRLGTQTGSLEVDEGQVATWSASALEPGDILLFHSFTAHRALPNTSTGVRLSVDVRYQRASDPVNPQCLTLDGAPYGWDDVYAGWNDVSLQRYWEHLPLTFRPFDARYHRQRDQAALALARSGDPRGIHELRRLVQCRDEAVRAEATSLLNGLEGR